MIFYAIKSPKLLSWLEPDGITANIDTNEDMASVFSIELDEDYDRISHKVTQRQFSRVYLSWIQHCASKRQDGAVSRKKRDLTLLCMLNTMNAGRYICYLHVLVEPKHNLTGFLLQ